jgi:NADH-quinone oxidoreductase subunit M
MPRYATVFMILTMASIGLPGTSGFVGEFLTLLGVFQTDPVAAALAALGLVLGAAYMLRLYGLVFTGAPRNPKIAGLTDLSAREMALFLPILFLVIWMGVAPGPVRHLYQPAAQKIAALYAAREAP